jgi:hypothetical protein
MKPETTIMLRTSLLAGAAALCVATASLAADPKTVKSVDVAMELAAVTNTTAASYWANIATDLISDEGLDITIDIEEVELSTGFEDQLGLADTRLVGDVRFRDDKDGSRNADFQLSVDVNAAKPMIPAGTDLSVLPADTRVYYDALIAAFAQAVVDRLT